MEIVTGSVSTSGGQTHTPVKIQKHELYDENVYSPYDIAVITLSDNIIFNEFQNKINLTTIPARDGVVATASGWGYLNASLPAVTLTLNKIQLKTISEDECLQRFGPTAPIYGYQICTFNGTGYGVCGGDSGGPRAYNGKLIGIVSWGVPCAVGLPDVYVSVYHQLDWLQSIMDES